MAGEPNFCETDAFCEAIPDSRCFLGIPAVNQPGDTTEDCGVGCYPCLTDGGMRINVSMNDGDRWIMPNGTLDAHGASHDMTSNQSVAMPPEVSHLVASCWNNDGVELFAREYCPTCMPGPQFGADENHQGPIRGMLHDDFFYNGHEHNQFTVHCRHYLEDVDLPFHTRSKPLTYQGIFLRSGVMERNRPCHSNQMKEHAGRRLDPNKCDPGSEFYNDDSRRNVFNAMFMSYHGVRILASEDAPLQNATVRALKNAALNYVLDPEVVLPGHDPLGTNFDRLDYENIQGGFGRLNLWSREWNTLENFDLPPEDLPTVPGVTVPGRLRYRDCTLTAELVIVGVSIIVDMVPWASCSGIDTCASGEERHVHVSARTHVLIHTTLRAAFDEPCDGVVIHNQEADDGTPASQRLPWVADDQIIWLDADGRLFQPPNVVEWFGYQGQQNHTGDVWDDVHSLHEPGDPECIQGFGRAANGIRLARELTGTRILGWPMRKGSLPERPRQIYGGNVEFGFNWEIFC